MNEFKGTPGKWETLSSSVKDRACYVNDLKVGVKDDENKVFSQICDLQNSSVRLSVDEKMYNAKLISCAPEMLEMLIRMRDNEDRDITDYMDLKELITKATTI